MCVEGQLCMPRCQSQLKKSDHELRGPILFPPWGVSGLESRLLILAASEPSPWPLIWFVEIGCYIAQTEFECLNFYRGWNYSKVLYYQAWTHILSKWTQRWCNKNPEKGFLQVQQLIEEREKQKDIRWISKSSRTPWSSKWVPGHPGLHTDKPCLENQ